MILFFPQLDIAVNILERLSEEPAISQKGVARELTRSVSDILDVDESNLRTAQNAENQQTSTR